MSPTVLKLFVILTAIVIHLQWDGGERVTAFLCAGAMGLVLLCVQWLRRRSRKSLAAFVWVVVIFAVLGARSHFAQEIPEPPPVWNDWPADGPEYRRSIPTHAHIIEKTGPTRYIMELKPLRIERRIGGRWYTDEELDVSHFRGYVNINDPELVAGCHLTLRIYGRGVPQEITSASFASYLQRKGISTVLRLSSRYHVIDRDCSQPAASAKLAIQASDRLEMAGYSVEARRLVLAMLFGKSGWMGWDLKSRAVASGILHLFAASGLHLGIVYAILYLPLARLLGRYHPAALLLPLLICIGYGWLTAFPVSLVRALAFLFAFALRGVWARRIEIKDVLLNAALALIVFLPKESTGPGSALSFAAAASLLYLLKPFYTVMPGNRMWSRFAFAQYAVSFVAGAATAPIIVFAFGQHAPLGILFNLILPPLTALLLPLVCGGLLLSYVPFLDWISYGVLWLSGWLAQCFVLVLQAIDPEQMGLRFESEDTPWFLYTCLALQIIFLLGLFRSHRRNASPGRRARRCVFWASIVLSLASGPLSLFAYAPDRAWTEILYDGLSLLQPQANR